MAGIFLSLLIYPLLVAIFIYGVLKYIFSYWDRENFPFIKPIKIPFGNMQKFAKKERSFGMAVSDLYDETTRPYIGMYAFTRPAVLVRDAELAKRVLLTDYEHFHDRGVYCNEERHPMSATLFTMRGQEWTLLNR